MVVYEVEFEGVAILKTERQPPITADYEARDARKRALQAVQPPAWVDAYVFQLLCRIYGRKHVPQPVDKMRGQSACCIFLKKPSQAFVQKASNCHVSQCNLSIDGRQ